MSANRERNSDPSVVGFGGQLPDAVKSRFRPLSRRWRVAASGQPKRNFPINEYWR